MVFSPGLMIILTDAGGLESSIKQDSNAMTDAIGDDKDINTGIVAQEKGQFDANLRIAVDEPQAREPML